jgi:hypothetical protein
VTLRPHIIAIGRQCKDAIGQLRKLAGRFASLVVSMTQTRRVGTPRPIIVPKSSQIDLDGQWKRVTGQVDSALARSKAVASAQATAIEKLDAAEYAFDRLLEELSAAMTVTPRTVTTATLLSMRDASSDGASPGRIAA